MEEKQLTFEEFKELSMKQKRTKEEWENFIERVTLARDHLILETKYNNERFSHDLEIDRLNAKLKDDRRTITSMQDSLDKTQDVIDELRKKVTDLTLQKMQLERSLSKRTIWQILRLKPVKQ